ncbi:hypothetical protein CA13_67830 [Planctomycetes bacterium CA13]|uniref:Uncharacterized protein n=1 Tax=Novipirellula herctigrandis TaxID=2527986 RepID=A0A5C5YNC0_9BACT|nr:hypothetical protein CA13_67830 [Planctomycetes bacterium CA13]
MQQMRQRLWGQPACSCEANRGEVSERHLGFQPILMFRRFLAALIAHSGRRCFTAIGDTRCVTGDAKKCKTVELSVKHSLLRSEKTRPLALPTVLALAFFASKLAIEDGSQSATKSI